MSENGRDAEAVSKFVESFAAQLVEAGMQRMAARVFAALLSSDAGVMTSAELGEQLRISPAAVSGAVRYLAQAHMVSREREPGSRRERYRVHGDQWYEALTNRDTLIKRWEGALREGVVSLGPHTPAGRRMAETLAFFEFIEGEISAMMERWRVHRVTVFGEDQRPPAAASAPSSPPAPSAPAAGSGTGPAA
ncbi:MarR family transcriptional regulator [Streptomyces sp. NBC_00015]|uniref:GbsR/MarR family transcriptional regulator n=1 Tax=unclassified Streptomyces TaxID=2593676 RepID=UPI00225643B5|nr:MarR family transcriptional regulator [Streptomyces sp. NBC_00103]MCX5369049.1 MarR family transcriptional regulator [Streptomyces sp. NBC_00103]